MKTRKTKLALVLFITLSQIVWGQGSLTPSGGPAASMKSLGEIDQSISNVLISVKRAEPRTPLIAGESGVSIDASGSISINSSGSYYLTENLTVSFGNGITINSDEVTLDLNGFTIRSTSTSTTGAGIYINGSSISIFNGHIKSGTSYDSSASGDQYTGTGFSHGIYASTYAKDKIRIKDMTVSGCDLHGIYLYAGSSCIVESCVVQIVGRTGIYAGIINNCSSTTCGGSAIIGITISNCKGESNGGYGIYAIGVVLNSHGSTSSTSSNYKGIYATYSVKNSYGSSMGGHGINSTCVENSYGSSTSQETTSKGIYCSMVQNSYGYSRYGTGIDSTIASYSMGMGGSSSSVYGIQSITAVACQSYNGENITHKYNMP
jgi:hypothetical protein